MLRCVHLNQRGTHHEFQSQIFRRLESGEQFRKTTSTPSSKKSKLDQDKAMAWFIDAMREKRVTRKEFNAIAINHNGRKASLIIEMK